MSLVKFGYKVNMLLIGTPSVAGAYFVGYDTDNILKQKDYLGNITPIGSSGVGTNNFYGLGTTVDGMGKTSSIYRTGPLFIGTGLGTTASGARFGVYGTSGALAVLTNDDNTTRFGATIYGNQGMVLGAAISSAHTMGTGYLTMHRAQANLGFSLGNGPAGQCNTMLSTNYTGLSIENSGGYISLSTYTQSSSQRNEAVLVTAWGTVIIGTASSTVLGTTASTYGLQVTKNSYFHSPVVMGSSLVVANDGTSFTATSPYANGLLTLRRNNAHLGFVIGNDNIQESNQILNTNSVNLDILSTSGISFRSFTSGNNSVTQERMRISQTGEIGIGMTGGIDGANGALTATASFPAKLNLNGTFNYTLPTTNTTSGEVVFFGNGNGLTPGDIYQLSATGSWNKINSLTIANGLLAVAIGLTASKNGMLTKGFSNFPSYSTTVGLTQYLSAVSGKFTQTAPANPKILGYSVATNTIYFNPNEVPYNIGDGYWQIVGGDLFNTNVGPVNLSNGVRIEGGIGVELNKVNANSKISDGGGTTHLRIEADGIMGFKGRVIFENDMSSSFGDLDIVHKKYVDTVKKEMVIRVGGQNATGLLSVVVKKNTLSGTPSLVFQRDSLGNFSCPGYDSTKYILSDTTMNNTVYRFVWDASNSLFKSVAFNSTTSIWDGSDAPFSTGGWIKIEEY